MVTISDINPLGKFNIGLGGIGNALMFFAICVAIIGLVGWIIYARISKKQYRHKIPLFRLVGNTPTMIGTFFAKDVPISPAGDKLWFIKGLKKFIAPATIQTGKNEYWHWEREDGEWINFGLADLDKAQKEAGVKYIHQDMRSQRIATANILEQRLINKGFWEKYKDVIVYLVFFIIVTLLMIVTFWQWGGIVEKIGSLVGTLNDVASKLDNLQCVGTRNPLVPALAPLMLLFRGRRWQ